MRRFVSTLLIAASIGFTGVGPILAAAPWAGDMRLSAAAVLMPQKVQYAGYCQKLKRACLYKAERGEWGRGNCHRYRVECGHARHCEQLRQACVYKEERGEAGQGNCRRYKHECGS
jgi:hypothetical protein